MTATATRTRKAPAPEAKVEQAPTAQPNLCRCGCKRETVRQSALYVAGHDARHAGEVGRSNATEAEVRKVFADQPKLAAKALRVRETAARKVAEKAAAAKAREAAKAAAKVAYDEALAAK
jgi:hypothetical protein